MELLGGDEGANTFFTLFFLEPMRWACVRVCAVVCQWGCVSGWETDPSLLSPFYPECLLHSDRYSLSHWNVHTP